MQSFVLGWIEWLFYMDLPRFTGLKLIVEQCKKKFPYIFLIFTIIYQNIYRIQNIKCPSIPKHELIEEILISINYKINHQVELNNADFVLTQKVSGDRLWEIYFSPVCLSLSHSGWVASVTGDCPECDSQTADRGPNTNLAQSAGVNFTMAWPGLAWPPCVTQSTSYLALCI